MNKGFSRSQWNRGELREQAVRIYGGGEEKEHMGKNLIEEIIKAKPWGSTVFGLFTTVDEVEWAKLGGSEISGILKIQKEYRKN